MENINNEVKTFTEEEVNKMVQSSTDKVRTEYSQKIKTIECELEKYKPKEKSKNEIELEEKLKVLEQKEKDLLAKENQFKVSETLEMNGINKQLAKYLNFSDVEDMDNYIGEIKELLNKQLLSNSFNPKNHASNKDSITKEQFDSMNYSEKVKLYQENQELFERLSK